VAEILADEAWVDDFLAVPRKNIHVFFAPFYRLLKKRTKFSLPGQARDTPRESRGGTDACFYCFLQDNNAALRDSYTKLTSALDEAGVPYLPGGASMFLWVLRKTASFFECFPYVCPEPVLAK
jgi:hypothetical protein